MVKTNIIYGTTITDNGSVSPGSFFTAENILAVKQGKISGSCVSWGNAIQPSAIIRKLTDSSPTSSSTLTSFDSSLGSVTVASDLNYLLGAQDSYGFDFGSAVTVDAIRFLYATFSANVSKACANSGDSWRVYKSSDNSNWTLVSTESSTKSLDKGEHIFSFAAQTARYFKVKVPIGLGWDWTNILSANQGLYLHRMYAINTSLGSSIKVLIDLGKNYKVSKFYAETYLTRKDRDNVVIKSSPDNSTYTSNLTTFGGSWTSLSSPSVNGNLLYSKKTRALYILQGVHTLHKYNILADSWSTISTGLPNDGITYTTAIDTDTDNIYAYGTNSKLYYYNISSSTGGELASAPYASTGYSRATFGKGRFWVTQVNTDYVSLETYNKKESMLLSYHVATNKWEALPGTNVATWSKGPASIFYIENSTVSSKPILLIGHLDGSSIIYNIDVFNYTGNLVSAAPGFSSSNTYNSVLGFGSTTQQNPYLSSQIGYDSTRNRLFMLGPFSGSIPTGDPTRRYWDLMWDLNLPNLYCFPGKDGTVGGGDLYALGATSPYSYITYVPEIRRMFRVGGEDIGTSSTSFKYYDIGRVNQLTGTLTSGDRYIKLENTSSYGWPFVLTEMSVIADTTDISYKISSQSKYGLDIDYSEGNPGTTYSFDVYNASTTTTSGTAYLEPDGTQGSRYTQVCLTSSGTYVSHCIYNDLVNFQCTASNSNYNTISCGIRCTQVNGGGSATAGYSRDSIALPAITQSGTQSIFVRSYVPSIHDESEKLARVITELYE